MDENTNILDAAYECVEKLKAENASLKQRIKELEDRLFASGEMNKPPCFCCGYNGANYYQPSVHRCAERHHNLNKEK